MDGFRIKSAFLYGGQTYSGAVAVCDGPVPPEDVTDKWPCVALSPEQLDQLAVRVRNLAFENRETRRLIDAGKWPPA